jgi:hypothetical protein
VSLDTDARAVYRVGDERARGGEVVGAVAPQVGAGQPRVLVDVAPLDVADEQLRIALDGHDEHLVLVERATNERVELARYTISTGERVVYGQRVLGVVRVVDHPADGHGRRYIIERELTVMAELEAIVADYLQQASAWDVIPAAGPCCLLADLREQGR